MSDTDIVMDGMKIVIGRMALAGDVDSVDRVKAGAVEIERLRSINAELADRLCECALHLEGKVSQLRHAEGRAPDAQALEAVSRARDVIGRTDPPRAALSRATKESDRG